MDEVNLNHQTGASRGSTKSYVIGFLLSLALTMAAYFIVYNFTESGSSNYSTNALMAAVAVLAVSQLTVQLLFFLHLGRESKPRWNLIVFLFAILVVFILVFGSLWIMYSLNYHHSEVAPTELDSQIIKDEGIEHQHH